MILQGAKKEKEKKILGSASLFFSFGLKCRCRCERRGSSGGVWLRVTAKVGRPPVTDLLDSSPLKFVAGGITSQLLHSTVGRQAHHSSTGCVLKHTQALCDVTKGMTSSPRLVTDNNPSLVFFYTLQYAQTLVIPHWQLCNVR